MTARTAPASHAAWHGVCPLYMGTLRDPRMSALSRTVMATAPNEEPCPVTRTPPSGQHWTEPGGVPTSGRCCRRRASPALYVAWLADRSA